MINWIIQTTENGNLEPVTAVIEAPTSTFNKIKVETFDFSDPSIPVSVRNEIISKGFNCDLVMILYVESISSGSDTFHITTAESGMLSENSSGIPNGVIAIFDSSSNISLASGETKGKIKIKY